MLSGLYTMKWKKKWPKHTKKRKKKDKLSKWIKIHDPTIGCLWETYFKYDIGGLRIKGQKSIY